MKRWRCFHRPLPTSYAHGRGIAGPVMRWGIRPPSQPCKSDGMRDPGGCPCRGGRIVTLPENRKRIPRYAFNVPVFKTKQKKVSSSGGFCARDCMNCRAYGKECKGCSSVERIASLMDDAPQASCAGMCGALSSWRCAIARGARAYRRA